ECNGEHSSLSGSNEAVLQRITAAWSESTVTWNNQPATTNQNEVILSQSTAIHQDYLSIDVLNLVNDMLQNPSSSFGFMIKLQTEIRITTMKFETIDNADCNIHTKHVITYPSSTPVNFIIFNPDDV